MKPQRGKTPKRQVKASKKDETDPVEVFARVKPLPQSEADDKCVKVISPTTLQLTPPEGSTAVRNGYVKESQCSFSYVFDEFTTQKQVFDRLALPLVDDLLGGKNALLFAYGVTSSGKTYTMEGKTSDQGILLRSLDVIFNSIGELQAKKYVFRPDKTNGFEVQTEASAMLERQNKDLMPQQLGQTPFRAPPTPKPGGYSYRVPDQTTVADVEEDNSYAVFITYVEIYNDRIFDLLEELQYDPITGYKAPQSKILREDQIKNMYVSGVTEIEVKSTEEAYDAFIRGQNRRKKAHTQLNFESSRSHSVFNIRLVQAPLDPRGQEVIQDKNKLVISQLSLVDLAGSERTKRTNNQGERLREAGGINQSLMVLRTCIEVLRENQQSGGSRLVPYRDAKVTHLFKNYFDGEGKVRMVVCVNPKSNEFDETTQVMNFAELTQEVQVARPSQVRFDTGLAHGRRRMNRAYQEAMERAVAGEEIDVPQIMLYDLGPSFPPLELRDLYDADTLPVLADYLHELGCRRLSLKEDFETSKVASFRNMLVKAEEENTALRQKVNEMENSSRILQQVTSERDKLLQKVRHLEAKNNDLQRENIRATSGRMFPTTSDPDLSIRQTPSKATAVGSYSRPGYMRPTLRTTRARSPPPTKPKPQVLPKYHRRSRSQDAWLDHRPLVPIETGSLMQTVMKKKKSVSKLDKKDLGRATKYALTTQDVDSDGAVATQVVKGVISHTTGGGRQVIYTDVEQLKQKSPGDRKRRSPRLAPEDFEGEWTDTDERCRIAIEGHTLHKKSKTAVV